MTDLKTAITVAKHGAFDLPTSYIDDYVDVEELIDDE